MCAIIFFQPHAARTKHDSCCFCTADSCPYPAILRCGPPYPHRPLERNGWRDLTKETKAAKHLSGAILAGLRSPHLTSTGGAERMRRSSGTTFLSDARLGSSRSGQCGRKSASSACGRTPGLHPFVRRRSDRESGAVLPSRHEGRADGDSPPPTTGEKRRKVDMRKQRRSPPPPLRMYFSFVLSLVRSFIFGERVAPL